MPARMASGMFSVVKTLVCRVYYQTGDNAESRTCETANHHQLIRWSQQRVHESENVVEQARPQQRPDDSSQHDGPASEAAAAWLRTEVPPAGTS